MKLEDRVKELEVALRWYVEEDEVNEGDPENQYWIAGKYKAMQLLGMEIGYPDLMKAEGYIDETHICTMPSTLRGIR